MNDKINKLLEEIEQFKPKDLDSLESFRINMIGRNGAITNLFKEFKSVPKEEKKEMGRRLNDLKNLVQSKISDYKNQFDNATTTDPHLDLFLPPISYKAGNRHPVSLIRNEIIAIFNRIGFTISEGPEIEDDWHVFSSLNFPKDHPARDLQDTFFIEKDPDILLRTHTSSVQVRVMDVEKPPIRTISPGRVFRNEAISARSHCIFHQIEGLYIATDVSFADLKQTLLFFAKEYFGPDTKIRLRPSFFPFTEPSAEMDISCNLCKGKGCRICKYTGWLEILGCGMVDPNVLKSSSIDPEKYTGFAFGMGIERIGLLKYHINDIRLYFENDVRFLQQFESFV